MFKNQKVLVTGGSGMIGRELVDLLLEEGASVTVADLVKPDDLPSEVCFKSVDLRHLQDCLDACEGMEYVFNLVGIKASPKMCAEQPADIMVPMIMFNTNMMHAAMQSNVKWYLYTSSVGVYQPAEILKEDDVWETQPSKNDWYGGWAKRIGELQAGAYEVQYGKSNISIVRPANVYGKYDNFDPANAMVIPSLIRKANDNDTLEVWGDGSPIRDFIHARDVARGMLHVVKNQITVPVNLGSGSGVSIRKIADIISSCFGKPIKWLTDAPSGDPRRVFDMSRAESSGFLPSITIEDGIQDTIEWFLNNKEIIDDRFNAFRGEEK